MNKIFDREFRDGLGPLMESNSISFFSSAQRYFPTDDEIVFSKAIAENQGQIDLYYMKSILASVGWNKNDDVFDPMEVWAAKGTPSDKQFNYMHNEKDIIGHITGSYISDREGNKLDNIAEASQLPQDFDIVISQVLYRYWTDEELKTRMASIVEDIESGKGTWHVSMECLFNSFDYALMNAKGESAIVKREETSAFLTKHLRVYGGAGEYNGYKVGRLLRNFSFSGVGLVEKPANPRSIILNNQKTISFIESKAQEIIMADKVEALELELAEAKKAKDDMRAKCDELESQVATLLSKVSESETALASAKTDKEKMAEEMKTAKSRLDEVEATLATMHKEKVLATRKLTLSEAGIAADTIEETIAKFAHLDDDAFEGIVAMLKNIAAKMPKEEKKEEDKSKAADEEIDTNEADAGLLEKVVASETDIPMNTSIEEPIKTFASDWFSKSVLKTTAGIK